MMMYSVDKIINGLSRYIDKNIYTGMNDVQELVARIVVGRAIQNSGAIKEALTSNGFIRTFGFIDADGMVDVDILAQDIKREVSRKGCLELNIPMFGKMKFTAEDVDDIKRCIAEG